MTSTNGFRDLGIEDRWLQGLDQLRIMTPTNIQAEAIPAVLAGKDVVAQSQTGTGKTLAYLLPMLQAIDPTSKHLQALVLVPTRELGMQILQVIDSLTKEIPAEQRVRSQALIGGAALSRQVEKLKEHPHIAVGTPGRIVELLGMRKITVHYVSTLAIDEVDQVLALGSASDVDRILKGMQRDRQLLYFSATVTDDVYQSAQQRMQDPVEVAINPEQLTSATIGHQYYVCEQRNKLDTLRRLVHVMKPKSGIVFVNATSDIQDVVSKLQHIGLSVMGLSGDAGKGERAQVMQAFREGKFQLLLATDVAARGLDIEGITHIFHLDLPVNNEYYLHRVGRTGRMGRKGMAVSIVSPKEVWIVEKIAKQLHITIQHKEMFGGKIVEPGEARHEYKAKPSAANSKSTPVSKQKANSASIAGAAPKPVGDKQKPIASKAQQAATPRKKSNKEIERERKNKGAPKWLKAKREEKQ
ncbi:DEAD/DEAH box helicase [Paenibacillus albiflavus]|nr:DEAD/DEAH box helicase [Paenibacillus albiflavus]